MKHSLLFGIGIVVFLLLFSACSRGGAEWEGEIFIEDGVTVVKNPKEPLYRGEILNLTEELVITGGPEEFPEAMFLNITGLDVGIDGTIYVLDSKAANIKVFDATGEFSRTIGRRGGGPGEFGSPTKIILSPKQEIVVVDLARRAIHFLSTQGNYLKMLPMNYVFFLGPEFFSDGTMIASYARMGDDFSLLLCRMDEKFQPELTYANLPMERLPKVHIFLYRFVDDLRWHVTTKNEIIWGSLTSPEYVLNILDRDGKQIRRITKAYDPISLTSDEYQKLMKEWFGGEPQSQRFQFIVPDHFPPFLTFLIDDEGRIFVKRFESTAHSDRHLIEIFNGEGKYIGDFIISKNVLPAVIKAGKMYAIVEDEDGFRVVKRYDLSWIH